MTCRFERLTDGFDAIGCIVLQSGSESVLREALARLSGDLPTFIWGLGKGDLGAAVQNWRGELRAAGLKRPLLLVSGAGVTDLRAAWPAPLMVHVAERSEQCSVADLAVARSDLAGFEVSIFGALEQQLSEPKTLNILVLYCDEFSHIETINEHLRSFSLYSRHNIFYLPVSDPEGKPSLEQLIGSDWPESWDFSYFDVIVWHYVVPAYLRQRLSPLASDRLEAFDGLKILFVQDEYDSTATTSGWMRRVGIDIMFTCTPPDAWEYVYPFSANPGVAFFRTLTGYVPEDRGISSFVQPMSERSLRIGYRGRVLPFRYGALAREKAEIGLEVKRLADAHGVLVDIAVDESSRIYGRDWYRFLGSTRATLATESGSNIFDFDGSLAALSEEAEAAGESFESFHARELAQIDGRVRMNQVSPKIFEAIRLRTALICFEGEYSGVIRPGAHYIPLAKDYSNIETVFSALEDIDALEAMTERAYVDVIGSGRYSYEAFVHEFDAIIADWTLRPAKAEFMSAPILRRRVGERWAPVVKPKAIETALNTGILQRGDGRVRLAELVEQTREDELRLERSHGASPPSDAKLVRTWESDKLVCYEYWRNAGASIERVDGGFAFMTPAIAWHYAAGVPLDLTGADAPLVHAWLIVWIRQVERGLRVGLYDPNSDTLAAEQEIPPQQQEQMVILKAASPEANMLLFRTGEKDMAASAVFLGAQLFTAAAYPPPVIEAARRLMLEAPRLLES